MIPASAAAPARPAPRNRALQALALLALLVPALLLATYAALSYREQFKDAEERVQRTAALVHEHGSKVFETYDLLAAQTDELMRGLSDDEVRSNERDLHERLARFMRSLPQVQDVWVLDASGRPLLTANVFPAPRQIDFSDREYFKRQVERDAGVYISEVLRGRAQNVRFFQFSRRRASPDGSFRGVIAVSVQPNYFRTHYSRVAQAGISTAALIRADGVILARYPDLPEGRTVLGPNSMFGQAIAASPERGLFQNKAVIDGTARLVAYDRLPGYPVYVTAAIDVPVIRAAWLQGLAWPFALGVPGALGLFTLARIALRHTRGETEARRLLEEQVTLRETAEAERRRADAVYRAYFDSTAERLFVMRYEARGRFVIEQLNRPTEEASGLDIERDRGRDLHQVLPEKVADHLSAQYQRCIDAGEPIRYEEELELAGKVRTWETLLAPIRDETGRTSHIIGAARDITERRQLEETLRQSQKLEAVSRLTAGICHDHNNLLMIIQGSAQSLRRKLPPDEKTTAFLDAILTATQRGQTLTRQLLAFARRGSQEPVSFDLRDRVPLLTTMLAQSARGDIRAAITVADGTWPIYADPNALEVALINLAVNARDAMPDGGVLTVSASNVSFATGSDAATGLNGDYVAISVSDTGTGIPEEHLSRVFEPFFTTKEHGKGSGLGLAQVYGFAKQAGGGVQVESVVGQGTRVTVYLPRSRAMPVESNDAGEATHVGATGHVLLVDDNEGVGRATEELLTGAGFGVTRVSSAAAALDRLRKGERFDLVLSDIVMPGLSGLEFAASLKRERPSLPVVLMTGYSEALLRGSEHGYPILTKPFTEAELVNTLAAASREAQVASVPEGAKVVSLHR